MTKERKRKKNGKSRKNWKLEETLEKKQLPNYANNYKTDKTSSTVKKGEGTKVGKYKGKRVKIKDHKLEIKGQVNEHVDIEDIKTPT